MHLCQIAIERSMSLIHSCEEKKNRVRNVFYLVMVKNTLLFVKIFLLTIFYEEGIHFEFLPEFRCIPVLFPLSKNYQRQWKWQGPPTFIYLGNVNTCT